MMERHLRGIVVFVLLALVLAGTSWAAAPDPPTSVVATAHNTTASIAFTAPASDGGSTITAYISTASVGGTTATAATSPITHTGLTNGTPTTFTVVAVNLDGTSAASAASNSITPATIPDAPTIGTATGGGTTISITFSAPGDDGGETILYYTATSTPAGGETTGTASAIVVTGLTKGTEYTIAVTATNAVGEGAASGASNAITPTTRPDAPTIGVATMANTTASLAFTCPADWGGTTVTYYTATGTPGSATTTGTASPITVTGLSTRTAYTWTVTATNATGESDASAASASVTYDEGAPDVPAIGVATAHATTASVTFTASVEDGGHTVTHYTITSDPADASTTGSTSPIIVTGLSGSSRYVFHATATNTSGTSAVSSDSNAIATENGWVSSVFTNAGSPMQERSLTWQSDYAENVVSAFPGVGGLLYVAVLEVDDTDTPTDQYDMTIKANGIWDVLGGQGANLTSGSATAAACFLVIDSSTSQVLCPVPVMGAPAIAITNAGAQKKGTITLSIIKQ